MCDFAPLEYTPVLENNPHQIYTVGLQQDALRNRPELGFDSK